MYQEIFEIHTRGRGTYEFTANIQKAVRNSGIEVGLCHVFVHHTSASVILCENADPDVRHDLETIFSRLAPDADPEYRHTLEGPDDMSAHVRSVLSTNDMSLPITNARCALGTWQGVYLWEHRTGHFTRKVTLTIS